MVIKSLVKLSARGFTKIRLNKAAKCLEPSWLTGVPDVPFFGTIGLKGLRGHVIGLGGFKNRW